MTIFLSTGSIIQVMDDDPEHPWSDCEEGELDDCVTCESVWLINDYSYILHFHAGLTKDILHIVHQGKHHN